jgi:hypothetical protein
MTARRSRSCLVSIRPLGKPTIWPLSSATNTIPSRSEAFQHLTDELGPVSRLARAPPVRVHRRNLIAKGVHQCLDLTSIVLLEPPNLRRASLQPVQFPSMSLVDRARTVPKRADAAR